MKSSRSLLGKRMFALDLVVDHRLAVARGLDAHHGFYAGGRLGGIAVAPAAIIARRTALGAGPFAHLGQLFLAGVAMIGFALFQQLEGDRAVAVGALILRDRFVVPGETEPGQAFQNGVAGGVGRTFAVRVLDAQQHLAARMAGIEPVEERGARAANVQVAGGRGREASDELSGHIKSWNGRGRADRGGGSAHGVFNGVHVA